MGLDGVELVVRVEETFDIRISDDEAAALRAPRDVVDLVAERVSATPDPRCVARDVFVALRTALADMTGLPHEALRPDTKLAALVAKDAWPRFWLELRVRAGAVDWPTSIDWPSVFRYGPRDLRALVIEICMEFPEPARGEPWTREAVAFAFRRIMRDQMALPDYRSFESFADLGVD